MSQRRPVAASPSATALIAAASFASLVLSVGTPATALAQTGAPAASDKRPDNASLLSDFVHYTRIANYELALSYGNELASHNLKNSDFVALIEGSGDVGLVEETLQRALRVQSLEPVAASFIKAYETGKLERARNPEQITKNITLLTTTDRGRRIAEERLVFAGEYAMPQLLEAYLDRSNPNRSTACSRVIVSLGQQAVMPLCVALMKVAPTQQELLCDLLAQIPHKSSLPFLADLSAQTSSESVRTAARKAFDRVGGATTAEPAALYRALAEGYYDERTDLTSFPGEENQLLWSYEPGAGLVMIAIKTPVYHEAMAMSLAERAMTLESASGGAHSDTLALWVASNLSREIDSPAGYDNPVYHATGDHARRTAEYFAVASGADVSQRVLARGLATRDTPLARRALAAVEKTAGVSSLLSESSAGPLVAALGYPNRRVQYEAALAIAAAAPSSPFSGSDRVVPILASTIRGATTQTAAVLANDPESYQSARAVLSKLGYSVMPQGRSLADLAAPMAEVPSVDLVVAVGVPADRIPALLEDVRGNSKTLATPAFFLTDPQSYVSIRRRYASDNTVAIRQTGIAEAAITETVKQLVDSASGGPISQDQAAKYADRALAALRDLAVSNNQVLNVSEASLPLIAALPASTGDVKMRTAEILSRINQDRAQRSIMDAAVAAAGPERVALLSLVAESGKRFGNKLESRHITKLVEMAAKGPDDEATAAAALIGAMGLGNTELVPLILSKR